MRVYLYRYSHALFNAYLMLKNSFISSTVYIILSLKFYLGKLWVITAGKLNDLPYFLEVTKIRVTIYL